MNLSLTRLLSNALPFVYSTFVCTMRFVAVDGRLRPMSLLQFYRAILSQNFIA